MNMKKDVSVLDLGTSKFCFAIAKNSPKNSNLSANARENDIRVLGVGYQKAMGLKKGSITNLDEIEDAILSAISTAEKESQKRINSTYVALPSWAVSSKIIENSINIGNIPVDDVHVKSLLDFDASKAIENSMEIVHVFPIYFSIDGSDGIQDPIGMVGEKLSATIHIICAPSSLLKNIKNTLERNNISVDGFLSSTYASALAVVLDEDFISGVTLIDIGASTTSIAYFYDGTLISLDSVPLGGQNITSDIAMVLRTSRANAERLKILHGVSSGEPENSNKEHIFVPRIDEYGEEHIQNISKDTLDSIVSARLEEIFDLVQIQINESNVTPAAHQRIVITGGGSTISGLNEFLKAKRYFSTSSVRLGKPIGIIGSHDFVQTASFSTAAGSVLYCMGEFENSGIRVPSNNKTFWHMIKTWFKRGA